MVASAKKKAEPSTSSTAERGSKGSGSVAHLSARPETALPRPQRETSGVQEDFDRASFQRDMETQFAKVRRNSLETVWILAQRWGVREVSAYLNIPVAQLERLSTFELRDLDEHCKVSPERAAAMNLAELMPDHPKAADRRRTQKPRQVVWQITKALAGTPGHSAGTDDQ